jgi:hypothetical protein
MGNAGKFIIYKEIDEEIVSPNVYPEEGIQNYFQEFSRTHDTEIYQTK